MKTKMVQEIQKQNNEFMDTFHKIVSQYNPIDRENIIFELTDVDYEKLEILYNAICVNRTQIDEIVNMDKIILN